METGREHLTYLDTHVAVWLCSGEVALPAAALAEIEGNDLLISPVVLLEMQFLRECGRLKVGPDEWLAILNRDFEVRVCSKSFHCVATAACSESWTRDPFDRLIVAHAKVGGGKLITKDRRIREHFSGAVW